MSDGDYFMHLAQILQKTKGKGKCRTPFFCIGIINTNDQVSESTGYYFSFRDHAVILQAHLTDTNRHCHHIGKRIRRPSHAPDGLNDKLPFLSHTGNTNGRFWIETNV